MTSLVLTLTHGLSSRHDNLLLVRNVDGLSAGFEGHRWEAIVAIANLAIGSHHVDGREAGGVIDGGAAADHQQNGVRACLSQML